VPLRPHEYTCIIITKMISDKAGSCAYREGVRFAPAPPQPDCTFDVLAHFNPKIAGLVLPVMGDRSMFPRYVAMRENLADRVKMAAPKVEICHPAAAALYSAYVRDVTGIDQTKAAAVLVKHPEISSKITGVLEDRLLHKNAANYDIVTHGFIGQELLRGAYDGL